MEGRKRTSPCCHWEKGKVVSALASVNDFFGQAQKPWKVEKSNRQKKNENWTWTNLCPNIILLMPL